ncbi:MAG TPA: hypothetical protein VNI01_10835, partial [Elusimicrobiota bacterium]|nr:hypothetical protein [Elusimicrobiota bacterium]
MRAPLLSALLLAGPGAAHAMTLVHQTPLDLEGSRVEGLRRLPFEKGLLEGAGTLESPAIAAETPFDDLVASWGAEIPTGAFLELGVQVRVGGKWSGWYRMGRWE